MYFYKRFWKTVNTDILYNNVGACVYPLLFYMKKIIIFLFTFFLFSCTATPENPQPETVIKTEANISEISSKIDNNSHYIGVHIANPKNLQISNLSFGTKGYGKKDPLDPNSTNSISFFFWAKSNNPESIQFFTNTRKTELQSDKKIYATFSVFDSKKWQQYIEQKAEPISNSNVVIYDLEKFIPKFYLDNYRENFEISHTDENWYENPQNRLIVDVANAMPFLTDNSHIRVTIPLEASKITYTTADGANHEYPMGEMRKNMKFSETESFCSEDYPWCTVIFSPQQAKNINTIMIEGIGPTK